MHSLRSGWRLLAGVLASALLLGLYARGGNLYLLGFVALVPWLLALDACTTALRALAAGVAMGIAFVAAAFGWFGFAIGEFTGLGAIGGWLVLLLAAPVLQPQLLAFALVRHLAGQRHGAAVRALAGACAWTGCEWLLPKLLGDTLGHGLYPSLPLRQLADLGGAAGISFVLLLVNEGIVVAIRQHRDGTRGWARPSLAIAAILLAWLGYGSWRAAAIAAHANAGEPLRVAMVQTNIVDYERLRRERGAYAVVREVLDTHFAMSRAAVEQGHADAVLWSETVYPTTYGHAKSEDGALLDREIADFVASIRAPLVFGSYDIDADGEYNAAAFLAPDGRTLGMYRKSDPFPLTEYVPRWLDGPAFRRLLPWTGTWQRGDGARVFPLQLADGREIPVQPLICLDDVDPALAIDGARLGAQAILGMSNDSWFSTHAQGAQLHLAVAAFRSIETRLPQFRVTANGISAAIDPAGTRVATTAIGAPALLTVALPVRTPPRTLMVAWGNWVGAAGLAGLLLLALHALWRRRCATAAQAVAATADTPEHADIVLLAPALRALLVLLQLASFATLAWIGWRMLVRDGLQVHALAQLTWFGYGVALPALCGCWLRRRHRAQVRIDGDALLFSRRDGNRHVPVRDIATVTPWTLPLPTPGLRLRLASGAALDCASGAHDPAQLAALLQRAGAPAIANTRGNTLALADAQARADAPRWRIDHPLCKFALFPLLLALPAFRLHQHIAFGGTFGEYYSFGLQAWLLGLLIWWAAWTIGMTLYAALLRSMVELGALAALLLRPQQAGAVRAALQSIARALYFIGAPAWLLWRMLAG
ncbi:apolipoprotein N-acyltransferase [Thermomonas aquatica]|uniref:apolipoprotein N-acyltransferase n=1 Tax=Thermomonas aquatica TaxID=2202149 RepID=UPI00197D2029|nr:apolipoprotein N-acyltransferase [Thermomonas aquatica]